MASDPPVLSADQALDFFALMVTDCGRASERIETGDDSGENISAGVLAHFLTGLAIDSLVSLAQDPEELNNMIQDFTRATVHALVQYGSQHRHQRVH